MFTYFNLSPQASIYEGKGGTLKRICTQGYFRLLIGAILVVLLISSFSIPLGNFGGAKPAYAAGNTYYVAKNGSDTNPGSSSQPWLTIGKAAKTMVSGDTVYVKAGTYNERVVPSNSGTSSAWITYKANPGDTVVISGSGISTGSTALLYINGKSYLEFDGFQILHSDYVGVQIWGASKYINLKNLTVNDTQRSGINTSYDGSASQYITNILISGCNVSNTNYSGQWEAISFNKTSNFEIANSVVHDTQGQSSSIGFRKEGIDLKVGSTNGSVHGNTVYNARQGIYIDSDGTVSNVSVYNNLVHNIDYFGIYFESESGNGVLSGASVYNNIVYSCPRGIVCGGGVSSTNISIVNNTTYQNSGNELSFTASAGTYKSCIVRNNIFYGSGVSIPSGAGVTQDHNLTGVNPLFVSAPSNFALQSSSPAINAGSATGAPSTDYKGASRPQGSGYDIGAYEYVSSTPTPTPTPTPAPTAAFNTSVTIQFTDASTGSVTSCLWDFGDGTTSTLQNPSHTYSNKGTYNITETVTGPGGSNQVTHTITIN